MTPEAQIRDAATLILVQDPQTDPKILMGRRLSNAVFMPDRFVFPGGAVDRSDAEVALAGGLSTTCRARLDGDLPPHAYAAAAIRELWEEAGLVFGTPGGFAPASGWESFAETGHCPDARGLTYMFRAVTPPGRPRRFDARFFLADAAGLAGDADDFSRASGELEELAWVPLAQLSTLDIAPVTSAALQILKDLLPELRPPAFLQVRGQPA